MGQNVINDTKEQDSKQLLKKRHGKANRFKICCFIALSFAAVFLLLFFGNIVVVARTAFQQAQVRVEIDYNELAVDMESVKPALPAYLQAVDDFVSIDLKHQFDSRLKESNPEALKGTSEKLWVWANSEVDQYLKGKDWALSKFVNEMLAPAKRRFPIVSDDVSEEILARLEHDLMADAAVILKEIGNENHARVELIDELRQKDMPPTEIMEQLKNLDDDCEALFESFRKQDARRRLLLDQFLNVKTPTSAEDEVEMEFAKEDEVIYKLYRRPRFRSIIERLESKDPAPNPVELLAMLQEKRVKPFQLLEKVYDRCSKVVDMVEIILNDTTRTPGGDTIKNLSRLELLQNLQAKDQLRMVFNRNFFFNGDSKHPELAGVRSAVIGTIMMLIVTLAVSFPIGVLSAVYLEEFAPDNTFTRTVEVNINNLAAVPSILFGLLGLAIFINFFSLPRSSALVGGLTLALRTLPVIIISTRAALRAIPDSIRKGALAVGATPWQTVLHHVVPLSLPGILTGTIIGLAQAMGETAPLIVIGMIAFIPDAPEGIMDSATVLPAQIYSWNGSALRGFEERTAAGILVLLVVLVLLNGTAILLRNRFERKW